MYDARTLRVNLERSDQVLHWDLSIIYNNGLKGWNVRLIRWVGEKVVWKCNIWRTCQIVKDANTDLSAPLTMGERPNCLLVQVEICSCLFCLADPQMNESRDTRFLGLFLIHGGMNGGFRASSYLCMWKSSWWHFNVMNQSHSTSIIHFILSSFADRLTKMKCNFDTIGLNWTSIQFKFSSLRELIMVSFQLFIRKVCVLNCYTWLFHLYSISLSSISHQK